VVRLGHKKNLQNIQHVARLGQEPLYTTKLDGCLCPTRTVKRHAEVMMYRQKEVILVLESLVSTGKDGIIMSRMMMMSTFTISRPSEVVRSSSLTKCPLFPSSARSALYFIIFVWTKVLMLKSMLRERRCRSQTWRSSWLQPGATHSHLKLNAGGVRP